VRRFLVPRAQWVAGLFGLILIAGCAGGGAASPSADPGKDKLAQILARGTLILPTDPAYPPSSFAVEGAARSPGTRCAPSQMTRAEMDGYDVSVGNLIADALGVEPCYLVPTWTEMLAGHWSDRWDIAFASIGVAKDRMENLYFTKPYIGIPERIWVRTDSPAQQMSDLDGKRIGVCTACWADLYLQKKLVVPGLTIDYKVDDAQIVDYAVEVSGLQDVAAGKLDAFLCADTVAKPLLDSGVALRGIDPAAYIGIPAGAIDRSSGLTVKGFYDKVNDILTAKFADGTLKNLSMKYFGQDYATSASAVDPASFNQDVQ
jgi:polar amino acid transport system substrate-binding protein